MKRFFQLAVILMALCLLAGCGATGAAKSTDESVSQTEQPYTPTPLIGENTPPAGGSSAAGSAASSETDEIVTQGGGGTDATLNIEYKNLDGLYFLPTARQQEFKNALETYLKAGKYAPARITFSGDIETSNNISYRFWLISSDKMVFVGQFNSEQSKYYFNIETDEAILEKYHSTMYGDGYYDEAAAAAANQATEQGN